MIIFVRYASTTHRALQKVIKLVEMYLLQWHSSIISIHNTHLNFCTVSNVHKNILAVILTSVVKLRWIPRMGVVELAMLCCYATEPESSKMVSNEVRVES